MSTLSKELQIPTLEVEHSCPYISEGFRKQILVKAKPGKI
jgi:hypothetical protein